MSKRERFSKQKVYESMIRGDADMSSFRRAPYYTARIPVHRNQPCKLEFPCSIGDTVYELYGNEVIPMIVTGFLNTQFGSYVLIAEDESQSPERRIAMSNVYLSPEAAKIAAMERKR